MNGKRAKLPIEDEEFYKELFRLNAEIDVDIDREVPEPEKCILTWLKKSKKVEPFARAAEKVLGEVHAGIRRSGHSELDVALQRIWIAVEARSLKEKGVYLFLITKYARAQLLTEPFKKDHDKSLNALTRFVTSNLSQLLPTGSLGGREEVESLYLRLLLLLEAVACATPRSSLGLLRQIDDLLPERATPHLRTVAPYWEAVLKYNGALAHIHEDARTDALQDLREALRECQSAATDKKLPDQDKEIITRYVLMPTLLTRAELCNKMQFGSNALQDLERIMGMTPSPYVEVKAKMWEALCRMDMGNLKAASLVFLELGRTDYSVLPRDWFSQGKGRLPKGSGIDLRSYPKLRLLALKVIFQMDLERRKNGSRKVSVAGPLRFLKILTEKTMDDRFERHNLKDFAIDWLETLANSKEFGDKQLQSAVRAGLSCLDVGPGATAGNEGGTPWKEEGRIQNEIWGGAFLRLHGRVKLWEALARLSDGTEELLHSCKRRRSEEENCAGNSLKTFLNRLVEFERNALGLEFKGGKLQFLGDGSNKKDKRPDFDWVYPAAGTYLHRSIMRRGWVLLNYSRAANHDDECPATGETCTKKYTSGFSWLMQEAATKEESGIHACLERFCSGWREAIDHLQDSGADVHDIDREPHEPRTPLKIQDYRHIIRDSDFQKHLEGGRSIQPAHWHEGDSAVNASSKATATGFGVQFVGLRRWNSYTPEISFSKGGGYFIFVPSQSEEENKDTTKPRHGGVSRSTRLGIVMDPGFDFIHNFFRQGFTLDDIDAVIITHGDSDHVNDFRGLADLLRERKKRLGGGAKAKKIYTVMPARTRKLLDRYIADPAFRQLYYDTILVERPGVPRDDGERKPSSYTFALVTEQAKGDKPHLLVSWGKEETETPNHLRVDVRPVPASHDDHTGDTDTDGAFGYVLTFSEGGTEPLAVIGYTGDSQWFPEFASSFERCDLVCAHMGSVLGESDKNYGEKEISEGAFEALIRKKNHPYLPGEILFLEQLRKSGANAAVERLIVLSEFGEEMKGMMRGDICRRINQCLKGSTQEKRCWHHFSVSPAKLPEPLQDRCGGCDKSPEPQGLRVVPADVGLRISVRRGDKPKVHCALCECFFPADEIEWICHGPEEALFYVCGTCYRSKSTDVRVRQYGAILDSGRQLRRAETR